MFTPLPGSRSDRRGRGARRFVQADGRLLLFGARPRGRAREPARRAGRARLGDAGARELSQRDERPLRAASSCPSASTRARRASNASRSTAPAPRTGSRRDCSRRSPSGSRRGEQSLVFINRRGYAPVLMCHSCGWLSGCHRCSAQLVLHLPARALHCHHCGHRAPRARGVSRLRQPGALRRSGRARSASKTRSRAHFPEARVLRIDRDSTRRKHAWERHARAHPGARGRHPGRHPDPRERPRFPASRAGRRAQCRRHALQRGLPRGRAPVRAAHAGRRTRRPRRSRRAKC